MPASTPRYGLPYQLGSDAPDGPNLGEDLALASEAALALYGSKPIARAVQQAAQTGLTSGATVSLTFGTGSNVVVSGINHSESVNNTRFVPQRAGWYRVVVKGAVAFGTNHQTLNAAVLKNGTVVDRSGNHKPNASDTNAGVHLETWVTCNGTTDYVEAALSMATSTGTWATNVTTNTQSAIMVEFMRDLV